MLRRAEAGFAGDLLKACTKMVAYLGVAPQQIAFDEF